MTLRTYGLMCVYALGCQLSSFYLYLPWASCDVALGLVGEAQRKCDVGRLRSCGWEWRGQDGKPRARVTALPFCQRPGGCGQSCVGELMDAGRRVLGVGEMGVRRALMETEWSGGLLSKT